MRGEALYTAAQYHRLAQGVVKTLLKDRTDTSFSLFWARILQPKTAEIQIIEDTKSVTQEEKSTSQARCWRTGYTPLS